MKKLIVASGNKGKLKEIKEILDGKYEIISMTEAGFSGDIEENGNSFYENALIKAKTVSEALGEDALADDSGLCVEALGGAPGIFSARYSGVGATAETNNQKLLNALDGVLDRKAKFCCSVVLYKASGEIISGYGETEGSILYKEEGDGGFGYDPLFYSDDLQKPFGLCSDEEKNGVSHRFRALTDLFKKL